MGENELYNGYTNVINSLLCKQIFVLLERVNYQFSSPVFLDLPEHKTIYTPIEKKILQTLEENRLSYQPQVRLGSYRLDFLVEHENKKILAECDGKAYHDPLKDRERDKVLTPKGYPICHFCRAEIASDVGTCIEVFRKTQEKIESLNQRIRKQTEAVIGLLQIEVGDLEEEIKFRDAIKPGVQEERRKIGGV